MHNAHEIPFTHTILVEFSHSFFLLNELELENHIVIVIQYAVPNTCTSVRFENCLTDDVGP